LEGSADERKKESVRRELMKEESMKSKLIKESRKV
jgi:hypothetical protein